MADVLIQKQSFLDEPYLGNQSSKVNRISGGRHLTAVPKTGDYHQIGPGRPLLRVCSKLSLKSIDIRGFDDI
jgi:hypothetical protein